MRRFFQYTLDLFDPPSPVERVQAAIDLVADAAPPVSAKASVPPESLAQVLAPARFEHPQANRTLQLDGAVVAYRFERARRRTIGFVVTSDGLAVRAPRWTPLAEVETALREKSDWIRRKLHESQERLRRQVATQMVWAHGATFAYLGVTVSIELDSGYAYGRGGAALVWDAATQGGAPIHAALKLALPTAAQPAQIRDAVQAWLMQQARQLFTERLNHFAPQLGVRWTRLSLSSAGTRWGSARVDGAIRLNWRLMHFTPAVIDYVVVHELSHLREMNHGPQFWDTVRSVVPDYAQLRGQLKDEIAPKW